MRKGISVRKLIIQRQVPGGRLPNLFLGFDLVDGNHHKHPSTPACEDLEYDAGVRSSGRPLRASRKAERRGRMSSSAEERELGHFTYTLLEAAGRKRQDPPFLEEACVWCLFEGGNLSNFEFRSANRLRNLNNNKKKKWAVCRISLKPNPAVRDPWPDVPVLVSLLPLAPRLHFSPSMDS